MVTTGLPRRTADRTNRAGCAARFPVVSHVSNRLPEEDGAYRQSRAGKSLTVQAEVARSYATAHPIEAAAWHGCERKMNECLLHRYFLARRAP